MPLVLSTGAGAVARRTIGFTVLGGMIGATSLAIFIVPVLFYVISRLSYGKKRLAYLKEHRAELAERKKKIDEDNIDPALEYDLNASKNKNDNKENQPGKDDQ